MPAETQGKATVLEYQRLQKQERNNHFSSEKYELSSLKSKSEGYWKTMKYRYMQTLL